MDIYEAMRMRHSVRRYENRKIEDDILARLKEEIDICNKEGNLNIQLVTDEPEAFTGALAKYGHFSGVQNYIALVGEKSDSLDERVGYYGERLVLLAQMLGLNTCWVALTFKKRKANVIISKGEKMSCVISLGYGTHQGKPHKDRPMSELCRVYGGEEMPDWFRNGMEAVMLAPTAVNQQKFLFELLEDGKTVKASALRGPCAKMDLGIVKYHFEIGVRGHDFDWA